MKFSLRDLCLVWNEHPFYVFTKALLGPSNTFIYKFTNCSNPNYESVHESSFWTIYAVKPAGLTKPAGFIFIAKGPVIRCTKQAIVSCNEGNSKEDIEHLTKTKPWSMSNLDLIKYEQEAEVITSILSIMGVDITIT